MQHNSGSTENQAVVKVQTRGQVIKITLILHMQIYKLVKYNIAHHLGAVTGCRVTSGDACRRTLKHRSNKISRVLLASGEDTTAQLEAEVKSLTKEVRDELLHQT